MNKLEVFSGDVYEPFNYGDTFARETVAGRERIKIAVNQDIVHLVQSLAGELSHPFHVLYVLHTTRTGAALGRYESSELTLADVRGFLLRFGRFLSEDARHDLWVHSPVDSATIVLDRHNLIYAYGPLDVFEAILLDSSIRSTSIEDLRDPTRLHHVHHYHEEWDNSERAILAALDWTMTPLRESDVQYVEPAGA